jgi:molybdopterin synthase sulfur carrier subunit
VPAQRALNLERLLATLCDTPGRRRVLFEDSGALRPEIQVLINGRNVKFLEGLRTTLGSGDEVSIFPPMYGG